MSFIRSERTIGEGRRWKVRQDEYWSGLPDRVTLSAFSAFVIVSCGAAIAKQFPRTHPVVTNAVSMTVGTVILFTASVLAGKAQMMPIQAQTWLAFRHIVLLVTFLGFYLFLFVLGRWTPSATSCRYVLIPLVTVVVAATFAGESNTLGIVVAASLVLPVVFVGALLRSKEGSSEGRDLELLTHSVVDRA